MIYLMIFYHNFKHNNAKYLINVLRIIEAKHGNLTQKLIKAK